MSQPTVSSKHPSGLFVLFFAEMWERFSYYGMRAILVLYVTNGLLFSDVYANDGVYGSYTGLVFLTPLLGGYFADRLWGNRRSIITGGFLMAIGQFLMFTSASLYADQTTAHVIMWTGLAFVIIGNGFFKPNISSMVGHLYPPNDKRLDSAYTIFYMGINLGAFISPLVCGGLGEQYDSDGNPVRDAFKWGFLAAGIAMILGTLAFIWLKNKYVINPEGKGVGILPNIMNTKTPGLTTRETTKASLNNVGLWAVISVALFIELTFFLEVHWIGSFVLSVAIAVSGLIISDPSLTPIEKGRVLVIFLSAFFVIFFWAAFEQAGSSLTLFAERDTDRLVNINSTMGTMVLIILAIAALLYYLLQRIMHIPVELKFVFGGLAVATLGYAVYHYIQGTPYTLREVKASWFASVNALWILILAPVLSQVWIALGKGKIEPSSPKKQAMGLLFLALGYLVIAIGVKGDVQKASMLWLLALYFLHTLGELCLSPIGLSLVNKLAPARFASILMGVWFTSNALANIFAGKLGALYPGEGPTIFLGYRIENLYDFFMLFVVMSGIAAVLLFILSYWMEKRMGEVK
ncbi:MAG TPA: peptide MFS transporter [Flavitalea sp.]|nr:peptide MFS transporter [Flavitalea sp.]